MPDNLGRYTLAEMRERVQRRLDAVFPASVNEAGEETGPLTKDPLFSNVDVDGEINSSLTAHYIDTILNNTTTLADEERVEINITDTEYPLPTDLAVLRSLWWRDPNKTAELPVKHPIYMQMWDEDKPIIDEMVNDAPSYRLGLESFTIDKPPTKPTTVLVRYIKWPNWLSLDDAVLETRWARVLQELIIIDAAIQLVESRSHLDVANWRTQLSMWEQRFASLVRNSVIPPFVTMTTHKPLLRRSVR